VLCEACCDSTTVFFYDNSLFAVFEIAQRNGLVSEIAPAFSDSALHMLSSRDQLVALMVLVSDHLIRKPREVVDVERYVKHAVTAPFFFEGNSLLP